MIQKMRQKMNKGEKMSKYNFEQKRNDYMSPPELVKMALQN